MSRLTKPKRQDILAKLNTPQQFVAKQGQFGTNQRQQPDASLPRQCGAGEMFDPQNMAAFEENVLKILREFGCRCKWPSCPANRAVISGQSGP